MTTGSRQDRPEGGRTLSTIVVPLDGSALAEQALSYAARVARARVILSAEVGSMPAATIVDLARDEHADLIAMATAQPPVHAAHAAPVKS